MKLTGVVCVAILLMATTVELVHFHGLAVETFSPHVSTGTNVTTPERSCAICFAAHSPALVFALAGLAERAVQANTVFVAQPTRVLYTLHFSLFVRPPPQG